MPLIRFSILLTSLFLTACSSPGPTPNLIIHNAEIWTANESSPWAEAMAIHADTTSVGGVRVY